MENTTNPQVATAIAKLETSVETLDKTLNTLMSSVKAQERRLHAVYTVVVLVVGAVGGPNAVAMLTGAG
jgi:hypothetical protein